MRVAVIGSRNYPDLMHVKFFVQTEMHPGDTLISGGARGVDATAEAEARRLRIDVISIRPNYDLYGMRAPLVRNKDIVAGCDCVVAFWDGASAGTMHTVRLALKAGKPVRLVTVNGHRDLSPESVEPARQITRQESLFPQEE